MKTITSEDNNIWNRASEKPYFFLSLLEDTLLLASFSVGGILLKEIGLIGELKSLGPITSILLIIGLLAAALTLVNTGERIFNHYRYRKHKFLATGEEGDPLYFARYFCKRKEYLKYPFLNEIKSLRDRNSIPGLFLEAGGPDDFTPEYAVAVYWLLATKRVTSISVYLPHYYDTELLRENIDIIANMKRFSAAYPELSEVQYQTEHMGVVPEEAGKIALLSCLTINLPGSGQNESHLNIVGRGDVTGRTDEKFWKMVREAFLKESPPQGVNNFGTIFLDCGERPEGILFTKNNDGKVEIIPDRKSA